MLALICSGSRSLGQLPWAFKQSGLVGGLAGLRNGVLLLTCALASLQAFYSSACCQTTLCACSHGAYPIIEISLSLCVDRCGHLARAELIEQPATAFAKPKLHSVNPTYPEIGSQLAWMHTFLILLADQAVSRSGVLAWSSFGSACSR